MWRKELLQPSTIGKKGQDDNQSIELALFEDKKQEAYDWGQLHIGDYHV